MYIFSNASTAEHKVIFGLKFKPKINDLKSIL